MEVRLARNRRRTLWALCAFAATALLWLLYLARPSQWIYRAAVNLAEAHNGGSPHPRRASVERPAQPVYPYSVIPGGVDSAASLSMALARDSVAAAHYSGFDVEKARVERARAGERMYASYRIGNAVYWTRTPVRLTENETLLTDGANIVRARCGNRLSHTRRTPVGPIVDTESGPLEEPPFPPPVGPIPGYAPSQLVNEIFPRFLAIPNRLPAPAAIEGATALAGSVTPGSAGAESGGTAADRAADAAGNANGGWFWWTGPVPYGIVEYPVVQDFPISGSPGWSDFNQPGVSFGVVSFGNVDYAYWRSGSGYSTSDEVFRELATSSPTSTAPQFSGGETPIVPVMPLTIDTSSGTLDFPLHPPGTPGEQHLEDGPGGTTPPWQPTIPSEPGGNTPQDVAEVPEPSGMWLIPGGAIFLAVWRRRRS